MNEFRQIAFGKLTLRTARAAITLLIVALVTRSALALPSVPLAGFWQRQTLISAIGDAHFSRVELALTYPPAEGDPNNDTAVTTFPLYLTREEAPMFLNTLGRLNAATVLKRGPGTFRFFMSSPSAASGKFEYVSDREFNVFLSIHRIEAPSTAQSLLLATDEITSDFIEHALLPANPSLTLGDLLDLARHRISPFKVRFFEQRGNRDNSIRGLIRYAETSPTVAIFEHTYD